jgi:glutamate racemase
MGCKLIVVACNTATTNISELRENYDVPFIGIRPAIKPAVANSKRKLRYSSNTRHIKELFNKAAEDVSQ